MNKFTEHIIRFIGLVLLQILILNNIQISGYINPYAYLLFVMILPPKMEKIFVLVCAFILGLIIDIFSDSFGVHTAAIVFLAYTRPKLLALVSIKGGENLEEISMKQLRFSRFFTYASLSCFLHHFILFILDAFRISEFFDTMIRTFYSSIISLAIILLIESLRSNSRIK